MIGLILLIGILSMLGVLSYLVIYFIAEATRPRHNVKKRWENLE